MKWSWYSDSTESFVFIGFLRLLTLSSKLFVAVDDLIF